VLAALCAPCQQLFVPLGQVEEEAFRRASAASSSGRRRSGSSFGTAAVAESHAPGRVGQLPDALSRRSGSYATAAVAPQLGFGPSLWQNPAAQHPGAAPWRHQLAVTSEIQPAPLQRLSVPLQQLSAPPPAIEEYAVEDVRRASFVTAVPERPSAALRRQRAAGSQDVKLPSDPAAVNSQQQQHNHHHQRRQRSLERPPLAAAGGPPRSGPGGDKQGSSEADQERWPSLQQERRPSLQQERRASLEHHRQQLLQRRSGGVGDSGGSGGGSGSGSGGGGGGGGPTLEGLPRLGPLRRSSSSEREHVRCKPHLCSTTSLRPPQSILKIGSSTLC
jgi:hypothetical protein